MTWIERADKRRERSKTWQDDIEGNKFAIDSIIAPLHYEGILDSGNFNTAIDCTSVRENVAWFDGWRVVNSGWHYALGKDIDGHGDEDGWVGFGGRQGERWFKFRLLKVGYLHWLTKAWDDVGGAPDYDRSNLTRQNGELTFPTDESTQVVSSIANWENVWTTPGGGDLSVSWRVNGNRLKELITINQTGREWIETNHPPATALAETWFGFIFKLDWSDIPKVYRDSVLQNIEGDFADDGEAIELNDASDRLLGFMPISEVIVPNADRDLVEQQLLRKRFYKDGDDYYLMVGVRCDVLNSMAAGDLVFDPSIDKDVVATADDGTSEHGAGRDWWDDDFTIGFVGTYDAEQIGVWARFLSVTIPSGATIESNTYLSFYIDQKTGSTALTKVSAEDTSTPANPTTYDEYDTDIGNATTNQIDWDADLTLNQYNDSPSIQAVIQELQDSYDYSSGANILMLWYDDGSAGGNDRWDTNDYDSTTSRPPALHIEYTSGDYTISETDGLTVGESTSPAMSDMGVDIGLDESAYQGTGVRILGK